MIGLEFTKILANEKAYPKATVYNKNARKPSQNAQKQNRNNWIECSNTKV